MQEIFYPAEQLDRSVLQFRQMVLFSCHILTVYFTKYL